jgi:hypothetical protein
VRALAAGELLALWEHGAARHALDRSLLLCAWARPDLGADALADLPLGTVTASLLRLREASFGGRIAGHVVCTHCGERLELLLEVEALLHGASADTPLADIEVDGCAVRAPCTRDLAAVAGERDAARATRALLARCLRDPAVDAQALGEASVRAIGDALEALDPHADLAFAVRCEACGHDSSAQLDAGALLWDEVDARARQLLVEVHLLAGAYGWSEAAILALGAARRARYLALVSA